MFVVLLEIKDKVLIFVEKMKTTNCLKIE